MGGGVPPFPLFWRPQSGRIEALSRKSGLLTPDVPKKSAGVLRVLKSDDIQKHDELKPVL